MDNLYICFMFERNRTLDLIEILDFFPAIGIVGPRQVGKTTLAKYISKHLTKDSIYLDLENPRDLAKLEDPVLFFESHADKCVILDEIQVRKDLFPILRSMIDMNRVSGRFILLGSASPELIRNTAESLAGRIHYQELSPFLWLEIVSNNSKLTMQDHWLRGGFPNSLLANSDKQSIQWRTSFIRTYIERDLPLLGLNASPEQLSRLWQMIGHLHGQLLNYDSLSKSLGNKGPTIKKYIHFLKEAFLIRLLEPYHFNTKKRLVKSPKIYIRDSGLAHQVLRINNYGDLFGHPACGASWEAYVIEQIAQGLSADYEVYFYRTHQGAELDLLITKSYQPVMGIEIKFSSAPEISQGLQICMDDLKLSKSYVITPDSAFFKLSESIDVCSLEYFLKEFLP